MQVSVLTPSYNYATYLPTTLDSVRRQAGVSIEHVVVDDGSEDGSRTLLRGERDLVYVEQPNAGQAAALNAALERARGEWVCWLPSDDQLLPDAAVAAVGHGERVDADVVYGDTVFVNERTEVVRLLAQHRYSTRALGWYGTFLTPPSTFVRRSALTSAPWDTSLRQLLDWELWLQLDRAGAQFSYLPRPLSSFRRHSTQLSQNVTDVDRVEWQRVRQRYAVPDGPVVPRLGGRLLHVLGKARSRAYLRDAAVRRRFGGQRIEWTRSDGDERRARDLVAQASLPPPTSASSER